MSYLERDLNQELLEMSKTYPVVTIIGPRQSGKTTLVRHLFSELPYVSLENPDDLDFARNDPKAFLKQYQNGVILDEIQRLPILLSFIQGIVDEKPTKGQFILTGSHQHQLHQSVSQSLAGRTAVLKLLPFSLSELPKEIGAHELDYFLFNGMYPRVVADNVPATKFYRDYLQTYIERDVRQMINLKDLSLFQRFIKLCASRVGQLINTNAISNALGVSNPTVESWLSILEASFIVFRVSPYYENFGKRIIKSSKLYFTDVGLATYCLDIHEQAQLARDPLRGNLAENFIISEILKEKIHQGAQPSAYFYRDSNQREVDLLLKSGSQLIPIEIKSSTTFNQSFLKGLEYLKGIAKDKVAHGYVIYAGEREQAIKEWNVINFHNIQSVWEGV